MPSAGEPCRVPSCTTQSMTIAGPVCGTCLAENFTHREIKTLRNGEPKEDYLELLEQVESLINGVPGEEKQLDAF